MAVLPFDVLTFIGLQIKDNPTTLVAILHFPLQFFVNNIRIHG